MKNSVKELRTREGLSQQDLADRLGVSRQTIISIEKARYLPSLALAFPVRLIVRAADADIARELLDTDAPPPPDA